jgi:hypothetical protein
MPPPLIFMAQYTSITRMEAEVAPNATLSGEYGQEGEENNKMPPSLIIMAQSSGKNFHNPSFIWLCVLMSS